MRESGRRRWCPRNRKCIHRIPHGPRVLRNPEAPHSPIVRVYDRATRCRRFQLPAWYRTFDGGRGWRPKDHVGDLLSDHHAGRIQVAAGDAGHDGVVDDTQSLDAVNTALRIDHGHGIGAHLAGARGVIGAFGAFADQGVDLGVGSRGCPGFFSRSAEGIEGVLHGNVARLMHAGRRDRADRAGS